MRYSRSHHLLDPDITASSTRQIFNGRPRHRINPGETDDKSDAIRRRNDTAREDATITRSSKRINC
jgi:hypothetical protein